MPLLCRHHRRAALSPPAANAIEVSTNDSDCGVNAPGSTSLASSWSEARRTRMKSALTLAQEEYERTLSKLKRIDELSADEQAAAELHFASLPAQAQEELVAGMEAWRLEKERLFLERQAAADAEAQARQAAQAAIDEEIVASAVRRTRRDCEADDGQTALIALGLFDFAPRSEEEVDVGFEGSGARIQD